MHEELLDVLGAVSPNVQVLSISVTSCPALWHTTTNRGHNTIAPWCETRTTVDIFTSHNHSMVFNHLLVDAPTMGLKNNPPHLPEI